LCNNVRRDALACKLPRGGEAEGNRRVDWQPLMSPNALANTMIVSPCASAIAGKWSPPSAVTAPAPKKIKAKVPMNSAANAFANPFIS
jgi:hypothetical protein